VPPPPEQPPPRRPSRAGGPSPGPRPVRALRRGPAACRRPTGRARGSPHAPVRRGRAPGGAGGDGLAQGERPRGRAAGGHGGDGRGRWKRSFDFPILSAPTSPCWACARLRPLPYFLPRDRIDTVHRARAPRGTGYRAAPRRRRRLTSGIQYASNSCYIYLSMICFCQSVGNYILPKSRISVIQGM
jgi:hypothetical protein